MYKGSYNITGKLKYAEIWMKYAAISSTKQWRTWRICTNMQIKNMQYMCLLVIIPNMHKYSKYAHICKNDICIHMQKYAKICKPNMQKYAFSKYAQ